MTPLAARKMLGRYIGLMASRLASHLYVRPQARPAMRVQGDTLVTPFAAVPPDAVEELARSLMPRACVNTLAERGEASFTVRAVELQRRYQFVVRRRHGNLELEILEIGYRGEPPEISSVPFDPKRKPPTLLAEAVPEQG
jgi:Tfp pilus assembly ATPase PilU